MGKDRGTVDEKLILDGNIVSQNGNVLHPSPPSDRRVPADDGRHDPRVLLDLGVGHDDTPLQSDARANLAARSDDDVGTNQGRRVDLSSLWNTRAGSSQLKGVVERSRQEVRTGSMRTLPPLIQGCLGSERSGDDCDVRCER